MNKTKVLVFSDKGAKILINPAPEAYESLPHLVNPDVTFVQDYPPHYYNLVDGKIELASDAEASSRYLAPPKKEPPKPALETALPLPVQKHDHKTTLGLVLVFFLNLLFTILAVKWRK